MPKTPYNQITSPTFQKGRFLPDEGAMHAVPQKKVQSKSEPGEKVEDYSGDGYQAVRAGYFAGRVIAATYIKTGLHAAIQPHATKAYATLQSHVSVASTAVQSSRSTLATAIHPHAKVAYATFEPYVDTAAYVAKGATSLVAAGFRGTGSVLGFKGQSELQPGEPGHAGMATIADPKKIGTVQHKSHDGQRKA